MGEGGREAICFSSHSLGVLSEVTRGFLACIWHLGQWLAGESGGLGSLLSLQAVSPELGPYLGVG